MTDYQKIKEGVFELKEGGILENYSVPTKGYYIFKHKHKIYFSKRLKYIIESFKIDWKFNFENASNFIISGLYIKNETLIRQISFIQGPWDIKNVKGKISLKKKWDFTPEKKEDKKTYTELFLGELKPLLKNKVGLMLSSGYDSNSILFGAHKLKSLKKITAITHITSDKKNTKLNTKYSFNEYTQVKELAKLLDFNQINKTDSKNIGLHETLEYYSTEHIEPFYASSNLYWMRDLIQIFKSKNITQILNGQFGNFTISWEPIRINTFNNIKKYFRLIGIIPYNLTKLSEQSFWNNYYSIKPILQSSFSLKKITLSTTYPFKEYKKVVLGYTRMYRHFQTTSLEDLHEISITDITSTPKISNHLIHASEKSLESKSMKNSFVESLFNKEYCNLLKSNRKGIQGIDIIDKIYEEKEDFYRTIKNAPEDIKKLFCIKKIIAFIEKLERNKNTASYIKCISVCRIINLILFHKHLEIMNQQHLEISHLPQKKFQS